VIAGWCTIGELRGLSRPDVLRWGRMLDAHEAAVAEAHAKASARK
jgi:hypothetical protein